MSYFGIFLCCQLQPLYWIWNKYCSIEYSLGEWCVPHKVWGYTKVYHAASWWTQKLASTTFLGNSSISNDTKHKHSVGSISHIMLLTHTVHLRLTWEAQLSRRLCIHCSRNLCPTVSSLKFFVTISEKHWTLCVTVQRRRVNYDVL